MGDTSKYKEEKQIALGILAHVDAGKTTLSESMLHKGGIVDNIGRVDKKNAFLDNYELEKERGITIFSKQAVFRQTRQNIPDPCEKFWKTQITCQSCRQKLQKF